MKMKEVCALSGLSERAVRLYCEQGLLTPARTELRGRFYLDFEDHHIAELRQIATLRTAGFSLEEIKRILDEPHVIGSLLGDLRNRLAREQGEQSRVLAMLERIDPNAPPADVSALCAALTPMEQPRPYANGVALRDGEISFREFCARGGRESNLYTSLDRNIARGRVVMMFFRVFYWLDAVINLLTNFANGAVLGGLIVFAIELVLYIYLFRNALWSRIVLAIFYILNAIFLFRMMADVWPTEKITYVTTQNGATWQEISTTGSWLAVAFFAVSGLLYLACVYFLGFNKWVSDYLYDRSA